MQSTVLRIHNIVVNLNLTRSICSSNVQFASTREGRFLRKMMGANRRRKLFFNNAGELVKPSPIIETKVVSTHKTRRTEVLNKLFMKHITDLMASGEVAPQLLGRGIDISHVGITTDYKYLNVFWHGRNENHEESTESVLHRCAGQLQHELSQLRVMGNVPAIRFVKNKNLALAIEVEKRLDSCDYGEDFTPIHNVKREKEPVLITKLSLDIKSEILNLDLTNQNKEDEAYEIDLPEMRQDIFGLNCDFIMKKVKKSLHKAQNPVIDLSSLSSISANPGSSFKPENHITTSERRELFAQFLKQRQVESKRNKKCRIDENVHEETHYEFAVESENLSQEQDEDFEIDEKTLNSWK